MTQLHSIASLDYGDGRTCICRICECGKHHCPGHKVPFVGDTTYRDEYVPKQSEREAANRPRATVFPTKAEPGHYKTTKQEAAELLEGKELRPAESYKPRNAQINPLPFEGTTTNRADFPGHMPDYQRVKRQQEPLPKQHGVYVTTKGTMDQPVDELATHGQLPRPPKSFKGSDAEHQEVPFDGITSYTADYPPKEAPMDKKGRDVVLAQTLPENRDFQTTTNEAYVAHQLDRNRHLCPAAFVPPRPCSSDGHVKISVNNIPTGDVSY
ncbi:hypothetical protein STCU_04028 [Strigomonas culicis]|uniref:STOP axonemal protein n=1 Tax=Strigomonas culicis TaxID=28005 RepID=S9U930_9TRYP|nr:hypothetical protein STCU_05834 [Strigomonas culicis]EPY30515.1 hypothetical protein STCU_04028 [Strigomonas culicis]|eukprot:EPY27272.1 hypothetical protein STCU_05834 [Strigomonas culicis]